MTLADQHDADTAIAPDLPAPDGPLIGAENIPTPEWAAAGAHVAKAGLWQAVRSLPAAIAVVIRLAWRTSPRLTVLAGVVHAASGCVTAFGLLATADVFTALLAQGPTPERVVASLPAIAVVVGAYAARALLDTAVAAVEGVLRPRVSLAADDEVTAAVISVELLAFEDADFRELERQGARRGVDAIRSSLRQIADLVSSAIGMLAALVTAALLNPWLTPVLLLAALADGWAAARVAKLSYQHYLNTVTRSIRKSVIEDAATWRETALERHALRLQEPLLGEYRRVATSLMRDDIRLAHRSNLVRLVGRAAAGVGTGIAYLVLGLLLFTGQLDLALAGTAVLAMRTASGALSSAMHSITYLYEDSFHVDFYTKLLTEAAQRRAPTGGPAAPADPEIIRLRAVSFTYPGQKKPALSGIDLTIRRGEVIALVGENGSGKTTLGKLITGLFPPSSGSVLWDDIDLAVADHRTVHDRIGVIAQDPAEWPMTAKHNITVGRLGRSDPDQRAWRHALAASGADDVIADLPNGAETLLSRKFTGGQDLSGGQWQRVGVARGIYRDAAVLVADEPTAALDAKAEARVFAGLQQATASGSDGRTRRTTVLVTHRLANIKTADRIIVLDNGRIREIGTHDQLIAADGPYQQLFSIQAKQYLNSTLTRPNAIGRHTDVST